MTDIDFLKWLAEKAEGFEWKIDKDGDVFIIFPNGGFMAIDCLDDYNYKTIYYPLLLQRAIEEVNREYFCEGSAIFPWLILTTSHTYRVYNAILKTEKEYSFSWPCSTEEIDNAKQESLKYIYKQRSEQ